MGRAGSTNSGVALFVLSSTRKFISISIDFFSQDLYTHGLTGELTQQTPPSLLPLATRNLKCTYAFHFSAPIPTFYFVTRSENGLNKSQTASTKTFLTALTLNAIIAGVEIIVFTLVRRYFPLIYEPRSLSVFGAYARPLV
jgi:hypothetical protein